MSVLSNLQMYELLRESWDRFRHRFDGMRPSTNTSTDFAEGASALTGEMGQDFRVKMWHHHLKKEGFKLTYVPRDPNVNRYITDPSDPNLPGFLIEIGPEVALKIMALGHIP